MTGGTPTAGREVGAGAAPVATGGAAVAVRAEAVALPDALLARLGRALMLAGTVAAAKADGTVLIRTRIGDVAVRSTAPLPLGRPVSLQIPAQASPAVPAVRSAVPVVLLLPSGSPAASPAPAPAPVGRPPAAAPSGGAPLAPTPPGAAGAGAPTTTVPPPQPGVAMAPSPPVPPALHAPSAGQLSAQSPSLAGAARVVDPPPPAQAATAISAAATEVRTTAAAALPKAGPGATPPPATAQAGAPGPQPPTLAASAGALVKALDAGPAAAAVAAHRPLPAEPMPSPSTPAFPALREAIATLTRLDPALAQEVVRTALPQPDGRLGATLLAFVAAVRGGDVRSWLGDRAARTLESAGKGETLARLAAELSIGDRAGAPQPAAAADWRPQPFPLLHGGEIMPIQLWLRRTEESGDDDPQAAQDRPGARFLIDLELSRLGPLQLDGLVKERRFDMVLRSERRLARALRHQLLGIFADACETVDLTGTLTFQPGTQGWIRLAMRSGPATAITA